MMCQVLGQEPVRTRTCPCISVGNLPLLPALYQAHSRCTGKPEGPHMAFHEGDRELWGKAEPEMEGALLVAVSRGRSLTGTPGSFLPFGDDATWARYWMTFLVFSVFPAPDSPLRGRQREAKGVGKCTRQLPPILSRATPS